MCTCRCVWPPHGVSPTQCLQLSLSCLSVPSAPFSALPCDPGAGPSLYPPLQVGTVFGSVTGRSWRDSTGGRGLPSWFQCACFSWLPWCVPASLMVGAGALSDSLQEFSDTQVHSPRWEGFLLSFLASVHLPGGLPPSCPRESFWVSLAGTPTPGFLLSGLGLLHLSQLRNPAHHSPTQVRAASQPTFSPRSRLNACRFVVSVLAVEVLPRPQHPCSRKSLYMLVEPSVPVESFFVLNVSVS